MPKKTIVVEVETAYEYRIVCLACSLTQSQGNYPAEPALTAADILAEMGHNPGCDLSHVFRGMPKVSGRRTAENGVQITTYTITPGKWRDAEFEVL